MNTFSRGDCWGKLAFTLVALSGFASLQAQTDTNLASIIRNPPAPRRGPPIILILADNIGYGDLSCYGQAKIKTPHLDQLASEGIRFTSYYAGSPNDEASRTSLLTGLEPRHIGASSSHPLPTDAFTAAEFLKETGYHTGLIGEWNLGDTAPVEPVTKGFDEFAGFLSQTHARDYFSENIYRQDMTSGTNMLETLHQNWNRAHGLYLPDLLGDVAGNFIRINKPTALNHHRSFFLWVSYPVPHNGFAPNDSIYSGESWTQPAKDRASMITHLDDSVGHVLDVLAREKADTNTVVIFTSLGGPQLEGAMDPGFFNAAGPLRGQAGSVYEGGLRVPMIIRWPARIKPGQVSDFTWAAWDFLPTAADIALANPPKNTDGVSIMRVLTGRGKTNVHESFYWESGGDQPQQAARMDDWKMVRLGTNAPALYNLKTDAGEKDDVAGKNPDVVKKMATLLPDSAK